MNKCCILVCVATTVVAMQRLGADDQVWLEPQRPTSTESDWNPRAIEQLSGNVVSLDARQLRIILNGQVAESAIAAARVLWIEPGKPSPPEREAVELFQKGQFAAALSKLPVILKQPDRPPEWRQEWITMLAANAAWRSGRSAIALELVSQLDTRRPLPPLAISWLPVAWNNGRQRPDAVTAGAQRLDDASEAASLVAASWLLSSPERARAVSRLGQLSNSPSTTIRQLAEVLRWRTAAPPAVLKSWAEWQGKLDAMPMVLQVGPSVTLSDKLRAAGLTDHADRLKWSLELTPIHPHPRSVQASFGN